MSLTHAELTHADRHGHASPCPGEVVVVQTAHDEVITAGKNVLRVVTVYGCDACRKMISVDGDGKILNVYVRPERAAAELAKALDIKREG